MSVLTSWPTWLLVTCWLALTIAIAVGARWSLQRLLVPEQRAGSAAVAGPLMPALGATFALLMALALSGEATKLRGAEDEVSAEAASAARLAWAATSPGLDETALHPALLTYLEATRANEWSGQDEQGDPETLAALAALERSVRTAAAAPDLGSAQASELLGSLGAVTSARRQRLATGAHGLPDLYVAVVILSGLALIVNSAALALGATRRVALLTGGLVLVVGLAIALLFAVSAAFHGGFKASGFPIDQVVDDLRAGVFRP